MDFATFKKTLMEDCFPDELGITVGNDFSCNYHILVDEDGYIHLKGKYSFRRVKTSICIQDIEFRNEVPEFQRDAFFMINGDDALCFDWYDEEFYFYKNAIRCGSAFDYFTKFPV